MSQTAYIQSEGYGTPMYEHALAAWQGWKWDNYNVRFLSSEWVHRLSKEGVQKNEPVAASVEVIQKLFKAAGKTLPKPLNVPDELLAFAGRSITRCTLEEALLLLELEEKPTFIKPADTAKLFTGSLVQTPAHIALLFAELDPQTPVLVSPELNLVTEYRVFVDRNRQIAGMRHYLGDPFVRPSKLAIRMMIDHYTLAPCCYALDVAVTASGKTIVVECNDFWALGTYGFDPVTYSRLCAQRWHQLVSNASNS